MPEKKRHRGLKEKGKARRMAVTCDAEKKKEDTQVLSGV